MPTTLVRNPAQMVTELVNEANKVAAPRFMSLTYRNEAGELSNVSLLIGVDMVRVYQRDLQAIIRYLQTPGISALHRQAAEEIGSSLAESLALGIGYNTRYVHGPNAADTYLSLLPGIDINKSDNEVDRGTVYIMAYQQRKTVIEPGTYKSVKSRPLTIAKKEVKRLLHLRTERIRRYKIKMAARAAINGKTIILDVE